MTRLPDHLLVHQVTVRPKLGHSSVGTVYGDPFPLRCLREGKVRLVRDASGVERVSSARLFAAPGQADQLPPGSEVTWPGHTTEVLVAIDHDSGALGAPDHTEVSCE